MKLVAPDYYTLFSCIGSQCRHNCCIGWEIDVDDFSHVYYKSISGSLGQKLKDNIYIDGDGAHFILDENDRCPFLDADGLCQLIKEIGEDALCDICADHPRFRNYFSDRIEIGLGLSCEESARIIISNEKDVELVCVDDDSEELLPTLTEAQFFSEREKLFSLISKKDRSFLDKLSLICNEYNLSSFKNLSEWVKVFSEFEHLTSEWPAFLADLTIKEMSLNDIFSQTRFDKPFENLLHYFLFRHFLPSSADEMRAMVGASVLSVCMIAAVFFMRDNADIESLIDVARLYSSEIEYSDVNFDQLLLTIKDDCDV